MSEYGSAARLSCFSLISAIESDLRRTLADVFTAAGVPEFLHTDLRQLAIDRRARDSQTNLIAQSGDFELMDYLDFGDLSSLIFAHMPIMPSASADGLKDVAHKLVQLVPIRNRVCHSRPLEIEDFSTLNDASQAFVAIQHIDWPELRAALRMISENPAAVLRTSVPEFWISDSARLQNNLPVPEFEDTGFVGRSRDVSAVTKHLLGPYPVISIIGEGGLGKTALAIKVLYDLLEDQKALERFDAICWVSLKTHRLTATGISEINGAIRDSLGLFREVARELGDPGATTRSLSDLLAEVLDYMKEFRILLALDNLETIGHSEVVNFLRELSGASKVLITSRIGMGQIELAYPLVPLEGKDSSQLMRRTARAHNLKSILEAKQDSVDKWCKRLHFNPLAIKWFVSAVSLGRDPAQLTNAAGNDYKKFLHFSFANLYEGLSEEAKRVVLALGVIGRPVSRTELSLVMGFAAPELGQDNLDVALSLLFNSSVIRRASGNGTSNSSLFSLTEFATQFVRQLQVAGHEFGVKVQKALNRIRETSESAQRDVRYYKYQGRAVRAKTRDERLVTTILVQAMRESETQAYDKALQTLDRADLLLPQFVETHRIRAYVLVKANDPMRAKQEYEIAIECDPKSEITRYEYARFLAYELEDYDLAASMLDVVLKDAPDDFPPKSLKALVETRRGNYLDATKLYEELITLSAVDQITHHLVVIRDQAAESYRRWSEQHLQYRESTHFRRCIIRALEIIFESFKKGYRDRKLEHTLAEVCSEGIQGACILRDTDTAVEMVRLLTSHIDLLPPSILVRPSIERFGNAFQDVPGLEGAISRLPLQNGNASIGSRAVDASDGVQFGVIVNVVPMGKYAFIESQGSRWFFHRNHLSKPADWEKVHEGVQCRFIVGENSQGPCATRVVLQI